MTKLWAFMLYVVGVLLLVAAPVYMALMDRGVALWMILLQESIAGAWEESITFLLTIAVWDLMCVVGLVSAYGILSSIGVPVRSIFSPLFSERGMIPLAVALVGLSVGAWVALPGLDVGSRVSVEVAEFESGWRPESRLVTLRNTVEAGPSWSVTETSDSGGDRKATTYSPLVSADWRKGDPVHVFAETTQSGLKLPRIALDPAAEAVTPGTVEGVINRWRLGGRTEAAFRREGIVLAEDYIVIDVGADSAVGEVIAGACVAVIPLFVVGAEVFGKWRKSGTDQAQEPCSALVACPPEPGGLCPRCDMPLGDPPADDSVYVVCPACETLVDMTPAAPPSDNSSTLD